MKEKIINFSNEKTPVGSQHTWLYTSIIFFDRNINSWRRSWNRIHDVDVVTE